MKVWVVAFLVLQCGVLQAVDLIQSTVAVTTNYIAQGISNSDNKPALQGGLTLNDVLFDSGVYFYVWGSNVHMWDKHNKIAHLEIDTVAGIANPIGKNFKYDMHLLRYNYPDSKGLNYTDVIASGQFYFLTALVQYSPNVYDTRTNGTYMNLGVQYEVPEKLIELKGITISGGIGYYKLSRKANLRSYADYNLQISKSFEMSKTVNLVTALQWTNTNGKSVDPSRLKRNHVLGTVTLNF